MSKIKNTYQWLFAKSKDPKKLGITIGHYETQEDVLIAMPELYGKLYGRCWWSEIKTERKA